MKTLWMDPIALSIDILQNYCRQRIHVIYIYTETTFTFNSMRGKIISMYVIIIDYSGRQMRCSAPRHTSTIAYSNIVLMCFVQFASIVH